MAKRSLADYLVLALRLVLAAFACAALLPLATTAVDLRLSAITHPEIYDGDYQLAFLINGTAGGVVTLPTVIVAASVAVWLGATRLRTWLAWGAVLTLLGAKGLLTPAFVAAIVGTIAPAAEDWLLLAASIAFNLVAGAAAGALAWLVIRPDAWRASGPGEGAARG
jgi:hypothetical protein